MSYWSASEIATPLLGQGGVDAPSRKWPPSFEGAAGVVCSTTDNRWFEPTTPSAPAEVAAWHFFNGRRHPSLAKEGCFVRAVPFCRQRFCPGAERRPSPGSQGCGAI